MKTARIKILQTMVNSVFGKRPYAKDANTYYKMETTTPPPDHTTSTSNVTNGNDMTTPSTEQNSGTYIEDETLPPRLKKVKIDLYTAYVLDNLLDFVLDKNQKGWINITKEGFEAMYDFKRQLKKLERKQKEYKDAISRADSEKTSE